MQHLNPNATTYVPSSTQGSQEESSKEKMKEKKASLQKHPKDSTIQHGSGGLKNKENNKGSINTSGGRSDVKGKHGKGARKKQGKQVQRAETLDISRLNLDAKNPDGNSKEKKKRNRRRKPKNTTDFTPRFDAPDVRLRVLSKTLKPCSISVHDVLLIPELICPSNDKSIYERLVKEVKGENLFSLWHGDSHVIANDKYKQGQWKRESPTFMWVISKLENYFNMKINATRFNLYREGENDWKPYHHDRAAFTPNCPQNFTVAVSFGQEREIGFEHAGTGLKLFLNAPNGSVYTFSRDVNIEFKHGVVPVPPQSDSHGRISIICWGIVNMCTSGSRVTENMNPTAADLKLQS